jgi:hypothetical protein
MIDEEIYHYCSITCACYDGVYSVRTGWIKDKLKERLETKRDLFLLHYNEIDYGFETKKDLLEFLKEKIVKDCKCYQITDTEELRLDVEIPIINLKEIENND